MPNLRHCATAIAAMSLLVACGDQEELTEESASTTTTAAPGTTTATSTVPETSSTTTAAPTTTVPESTTTTTTTTPPPTEIEQPVVWPATDVVFDTPEAAAEDFVAEVLGVPPVLGEFRQGDAHSGEIEVFSPGEAGGSEVPRGVLVLRQLGPDDGWFVIAAVNDNASITWPDPMAEVPAGPLTVEGRARGFEATVIVTAFVAGDAGNELDQVLTHGGPFETPEPFTVTVDLTGAAAGDTVVLFVRGGTGLETDPGDFGAIPVVIAG